TPLQFEQLYERDWLDLELLLNQIASPGKVTAVSAAQVSGARVAFLYRRPCEHLARPRAPPNPAYIVDRLERLTADAHQLIYHRREAGAAKLKHLIAAEFPAAVRDHAAYFAR